MELEDIQRHACKFSRIGSNDSEMLESTKLRRADEGEYSEPKKRSDANVVDVGGGVGRFYSWPSSRIVRVSRASGGKDRHSKVLTSKGLRDRRVRLSVNTALQFYDLQDRLGYDQPSKAVEWLLKAADRSIQELPPINNLFPGIPKQLIDEARACDGDINQLGGRDSGGDYHQQLVIKSSACSSPSGSSERSGLSLFRSERTAVKEREKEIEFSDAASFNAISQTTSFTELLSVGLNHLINSDHNSPTTSPIGSSKSFQKSPRQWSSAPVDYFSNGLLVPPATARSPLFSLAGDHHPELQHFSFVPEQLVSVVNAAAAGENNDSNNSNHNGSSEHDLNFSISCYPNSLGLADFNRGTLQSNSTSPSVVPQLQRFPPIDGLPSFLIGTTGHMGNHHQFLSGFDSGLQLFHGIERGSNNGCQSDRKDKENN